MSEQVIYLKSDVWASKSGSEQAIYEEWWLSAQYIEEWWLSKQVSEWASNIWGVMTERAIYDPIMECASVQERVNKAQLNSIKQMALIFEGL